ncbi:hypothetical protein [Agrobacterium sp. B1(2019)]|uniref:hypothetical protein n=1 Tax=Agrobacterium sp. B1(2019) TaxID=2607032 RepID=UPI0011EF7C13|nr:hypothetical protein [Agrobacterium sp. B1(2019)]TZG36495.1 hypothetical protein AGR1_03065 [Agrobacterium sp. B1(2019)]
MPRKVFEASLFHLSPFAVEWLLRSDKFKMDFACAPFEGGLLIQCETRSSSKVPDNGTPEVDLVLGQSLSGATHLFFHEGGAVLHLPTHDKQTVLSTYKTPPFSKNCDDSDFARSGYEALLDESEFTAATPEEFTTMIMDCDQRLRQRSIYSADLEIEDDIEFAYNLACGVEYVKLESNQNWVRCDIAMKELAQAVDVYIRAFDRLYSQENRYLDGLILAAKSRIFRSLRVEDDWRRRPVM